MTKKKVKLFDTNAHIQKTAVDTHTHLIHLLTYTSKSLTDLVQNMNTH